MSFVRIDTGERIALDRGYDAPSVSYDAWEREPQRKKASAAPAVRHEAPAGPEPGVSGPAASLARGHVSPPPERRFTPAGGKGSWGREAALREPAPPSETGGSASGALEAMENRQRQRELDQLERQRQQAMADQDIQSLGRIERAQKNLRAAMGRQTLGDRVGDTLSGLLQSYAGALVNTVGTAQELAGAAQRRYLPLEIQERQRELTWYLENARYAADADERQYWEYEARRAREALAGYQAGLEESRSQGQQLQALADRMQNDGAVSIARAKRDLGAPGRLAVDVGAAGGQMLLDAGTAALTGGSALVPMALRSFGNAAQEARQAGADLEKQLTYGLGSAALGVGTEKISNIAGPFRKMFGQGAAETAAEALARRFGESEAVRLMQGLSRTAAGRTALSAIGEGGEEVVEDVLRPLLRRAVYDPGAEFDGGEAWNDFLVGAVLGGLGGGVDALGSVGSRPGHTRAETGVPAARAAPGGADAFLAGFLGEGAGPVQAGRGGVERAQSRIDGAGGPAETGGLPGTALDRLYAAALQNRPTQPWITADRRLELEAPALYHEYLRRVYGVQPAVPLLPGRSGVEWENPADSGGGAPVPLLPDTAEMGLDGPEAGESAAELNIPVENPVESDIIEDILIHRSLGAMARNYRVYDPDSGRYFYFVEGTRIKNPKVFAGKGGVKPLYPEVAEGLSEQFGGKPSEWQHCKGIGLLDYEGKACEAEVHWFQEASVGKHRFRVKIWFD